MIISSEANQQIKMIRKLKDRKFRQESGQFFLEGIRIVKEALDAGDSISQLIVARGLIENVTGQKTIEQAEIDGVPILEVTDEVFRSISSKDGPQGLAAVGKQKWSSLEDIGKPIDGTWIALYQVADPGNLGTILRSLDGMGGKGILLIDNCTDPYDPSAIRASMGAIFSKKIVKVNSNDFEKWIKQNSIHLIGTSDAAIKDFRSQRYPSDMVLLMGSEREGMPETLEKLCHSVVSIPMVGKADSLNLAVASSILLYEISWQNQQELRG